MASKAASTVAVPITPQLSESAFKFLQANADGDAATTLAQWVMHYVRQLSEGAVLIEGVDIQRLNSLSVSPQYSSPQGIIAAVEGFLKRKTSQYTFEVNVDPVYVPLIKEQADWANTTPEDLMQGGINFAIAQNWIFDFNGKLEQLPMSGEDREFFSGMLGKPTFTMADIRKAFEAATEPASREAA